MNTIFAFFYALIAVVSSFFGGGAGAEDTVVVTPVGEHIEAQYHGYIYFLEEDCSVTMWRDGEYVGGYDILEQVPSDVRIPMQDTAFDYQSWCVA